MPISHKHKVVFVHIPKTGGTSIESALGILGIDNKGSSKPNKDILFGKYKGKALQHLSIREIKKIKNTPSDYFTFSFVRNPYDRIVSEFFWRRQTIGIINKNMTFKEFLFKIVIPKRERMLSYDLRDDHFYDQLDFLTDENGEIIVDFIGRFENLENDFNKVCQICKINTKLPLILKSQRKDYKFYYDKETIDIVTKLYKKDIKTFNYKF
jgi:hypothetical protein